MLCGAVLFLIGTAFGLMGFQSPTWIYVEGFISGFGIALFVIPMYFRWDVSDG